MNSNQTFWKDVLIGILIVVVVLSIVVGMVYSVVSEPDDYEKEVRRQLSILKSEKMQRDAAIEAERRLKLLDKPDGR